MSDDESEYFSDGEKRPRRKKGQEAANMFKQRQEKNMTELDDTLSDFIEEWRIMRKREDEELSRLKARQAKRKVVRAEEEKRLKLQKKEEEERKVKEEAEIKKKEEEERLRRLEEMEKKRQESTKKSGEKKKLDGDKLSGIQSARGEKGKTREQLAEEKKIALMVRVAPLSGLEDMNLSLLCSKAEDLFKKIIRLETEKYDMEQRRARQDYDLRELKERQRVKLRSQALKKGLDAEALTGKHPPKIQVSSKFERRADSRSYDDKKKLFEGGYESEYQDKIEREWQEKYSEFVERNKSKLPKWFGERPGKGGGQWDEDSDEEDESEDTYKSDDDPNDYDEESEEEEEEESEGEDEESEEEDSESEEEEEEEEEE